MCGWSFCLLKWILVSLFTMLYPWGFPSVLCCYIAAPMLLYCSSNVVILQFQCCYIAAPMSLYCSSNIVILQLQCCYIAAPMLYISAPMSQCCAAWRRWSESRDSCPCTEAFCPEPSGASLPTESAWSSWALPSARSHKWACGTKECCDLRQSYTGAWVSRERHYSWHWQVFLSVIYVHLYMYNFAKIDIFMFVVDFLQQL